jgi:hypothetical protein
MGSWWNAGWGTAPRPSPATAAAGRRPHTAADLRDHIIGPLSFFLLQNALEAGSLVASQPGFTLTNLGVGGLGLAVFGELGRGGIFLIGPIAGALLIAAGSILLARFTPARPVQRRRRERRGRDGRAAPRPRRRI